MTKTQIKHLIKLSRTYLNLSKSLPSYKTPGLEILKQVKDEIKKRG